jgi:hypothetical protein
VQFGFSLPSSLDWPPGDLDMQKKEKTGSPKGQRAN